MNTYALSLLTVILFCFCAHKFMKSLLAPIPLYNNTDYTKGALRVAKAYRVFSWGVMGLCFMVGVVISFYQVFTEI